MTPAARIPVHILTGFLGSGKTTLLRHLLADSALADTAVVINEFGDVGLDHLLVRDVAENIVLLASGCLCCALRDDLLSTLIDLHHSAATGEIPAFSRVAIETTGLADPMPIMRAIVIDRQISRYYAMGRVVTTVDAINGVKTTEQFREAVHQLAIADCIVVTKADVADRDQIDRVMNHLGSFNATAARFVSKPGSFPSADDLFKDDRREFVPTNITLRQPIEPGISHQTAVSTFTLRLEEPIALPAFLDWLELLLASRGNSVLRVKGYLAAIGHDRPLVIQGVQHVVYKPAPLAAPLPGPLHTELVFITVNLTRRAIEESLRTLLPHATG